MSDGAKAGTSEDASTIVDTIVNPIKDEVGKAIEVGIQSITGSTQSLKTNPQNPQEAQQKKVDEDKRKVWAQKVIKWYQDIDAAQRKVREEKVREGQAKKQEEEQSKQVAQWKAQEKKQKQLSVAQLAERKSEVKRGVGG